MVNIYVVLGILFFHWLFDFVFQTDEQAKNKNTNWGALISHTFTYSLCWFIATLVFEAAGTQNPVMLLFAPITFIAHTATDYYTSKVNTQLWKEGKTHDFFVSIGFDQYLHYVQLLLTYYFLSK